MSDDRFDDLTPGERLAERDRTHPEPAPKRPPDLRSPANKYSWLVAIVMTMVLAMVLFLNTLPNSGEALFGLERGERLPDFAVPLATSNLEGDANVCQSEPCPSQSGAAPACSLHSASVMNICDLSRRPLVLTFIVDRGADCYPQVDRTERLKARLPEVQFATLFFTRKDRAQVKRLVRARRWTQPVGIDADGVVTNRYGVGGCPTTIFVRPGGRVLISKIGNLTERELEVTARRLLRVPAPEASS